MPELEGVSLGDLLKNELPHQSSKLSAANTRTLFITSESDQELAKAELNEIEKLL